jgi:hypothetical protein
MDTLELLSDKKEVVVDITDYDNRWNKVAAQIARERLYPASPLKSKEMPVNGGKDSCGSPSKKAGN